MVEIFFFFKGYPKALSALQQLHFGESPAQKNLGHAWLEDTAAPSLPSNLSSAHMPHPSQSACRLPFPKSDNDAEVATPVSIYFLTSGYQSTLMKS